MQWSCDKFALSQSASAIQELDAIIHFDETVESEDGNFGEKLGSLIGFTRSS